MLLPKSLQTQLVTYPLDIIPLFTIALQEILFEKNPNSKSQRLIKPFNAANIIDIRKIQPNDIEKMVNVTGIVLRTGDMTPEMIKAAYLCVFCNNKVKTRTYTSLSL